MKALQLGINYGMGVRSLSRGLDRHPLIGSEVIIRHQRRYPRFWEWRADMVERAMLERVIVSEFDGWPLHISTSPNKRTLYNFPMQSGGAEMLRLAANRLCDAGLVPSMLVHDGILFELDNEEQVQHAIEIMRIAGTEVCGGLEIGVDIDQKLIGGARYRDKRPVAKNMWETVMGVLREIGAMPERRWGERAGQDQELQVHGRQVGGANRRGAGQTRTAKGRASQARTPAKKTGAASREERFVMLTLSQAEKLLRARTCVLAPVHNPAVRELPAAGPAFHPADRQLNTVKGLEPEKPASGADPIGDVRPDFGNAEPATAAADRCSVGPGRSYSATPTE